MLKVTTWNVNSVGSGAPVDSSGTASQRQTPFRKPNVTDFTRIRPGIRYHDE